MFQRTVWITCLVCAMRCGRLDADDGLAHAEVTVKQLVDQWAQRRTRYRSIDATFVEQPVKESKSGNILLEAMRRNIDYQTAAKTINVDALTPAFACRLWCDGVKCRMELDMERMPRPERAQVMTFDGVTSKSLTPLFKRSEGVEYPAGFVHRDPVAKLDDIFMIRPIRWAFYGVNIGKMKFDVERMTMSKRAGVFDGCECAVVEYREPESDRVHVYWCDPGKDFAIVRYLSMAAQRVKLQLDCHYSRHETGLWLPAKWTTWWFDGNCAPVMIYEMTALTYVVNPTIDPSRFDLTFPTGAVISDLRPGKPKGRTGTYDYVVLENGGERRITWSERNATYPELLKTRSGEAGLPPRRMGLVRWLVTANATVLFAVVAGVIYRKVIRRT